MSRTVKYAPFLEICDALILNFLLCRPKSTFYECISLDSFVQSFQSGSARVLRKKQVAFEIASSLSRACLHLPGSLKASPTPDVQIPPGGVAVARPPIAQDAASLFPDPCSGPTPSPPGYQRPPRFPGLRPPFPDPPRYWKDFPPHKKSGRRSAGLLPFSAPPPGC